MKHILLTAFLTMLSGSLFASERPEQMRVQQPLTLSKNSRFLIFRDGNKTRESLADVEGKYAYCAIENLKLSKIKWTKKQDLVVNFQKLEFPNQKIIRYTLVENADYQIFCDFTEIPNFTESDLVKLVNKQFQGWFRIMLSV